MIFKLKDLCDFIGRGVSPAYTEDKINGVMVINQKCIRDNRINFDLVRFTDINKKKVSDIKYLKNDDILINSTGVGTLGRIAQIKNVDKNITVDSHVTIVRPNKEIDPRFLGYNLFMQQEFIESLGEGSTGQIELSKTKLSEFVDIEVPPLKEQQKISKNLSSLDEKIEINRKINENLEEQAKEIFKRWFVDYEFPNEEGQPYKSSGGEMIESELGLIPKGWEVKKLESIINISNGRRPKNKIKLKNRQYCIPIIGSSCITGYTDEFLYDEHVLVIGRVGTHGIVQRFKEKIWVSDNAMVIKSNYYEYTNQILNNICYENLNVGSTQPLITQSDIKKHLIKVPINRLINSFEKIVSSLYEKYYFNECEIQKLYSLRDTLLPKLMTGEIDVSKIDI